MSTPNPSSLPANLEQQRKLEIHLLDFRGDLYGAELAVEFVQRLRDTRKFDGAAQLVAQLHHDVAAARAAMSGSG